jgi:hypothetical protein
MTTSSDFYAFKLEASGRTLELSVQSYKCQNSGLICQCPYDRIPLLKVLFARKVVCVFPSSQMIHFGSLGCFTDLFADK